MLLSLFTDVQGNLFLSDECNVSGQITTIADDSLYPFSIYKTTIARKAVTT